MSFHPSADPSPRNLEQGSQRVLCWAFLERRVAKRVRDGVSVISWARPKPLLPLAPLRQLAGCASLEVLQPFGARRTPPPLGPACASRCQVLQLKPGSMVLGASLVRILQPVWAVAPHLSSPTPLSSLSCALLFCYQLSLLPFGVAAAFICPLGWVGSAMRTSWRSLCGPWAGALGLTRTPC